MTLFPPDHGSCNYDQSEILRSIIMMHNAGYPFHCDPCYNAGSMHQGLPSPILKFDLHPRVNSCIKATYHNLPLDACSVRSFVVDPPFLIGEDTIMAARYGSFPDLCTLQLDYFKLCAELTRCIRRNGLLVFKCQDLILDRRKYFVSRLVVNLLQAEGWNQIDEYIKLNKQRPQSPNNAPVHGSRGFHSKFLVFRYRRGSRKYMISTPGE